ncbi:NAD(P)-binding protein [Auricularia subglabra TFB-10046 SS5]|nr:NAD(P)-binding protein [Auricularia subglabra TFB-10046 SS5]
MPTVIITGASRGLGLVATALLLADGAHVVTVQRSSTPELTALETKYPNALRIVQGDYTQDAIVTRALHEAEEHFGGLDALVFNAATNLPLGQLGALTPEGWQRLFELDFFGVVRLLTAALPLLRKSPQARVIMVSSEAANIGIPGGAPYSAAKAALNSLNGAHTRYSGSRCWCSSCMRRSLAAEEPTITSVAFHPGAVRTEMVRDMVRESKGHVPDEFIKAVVESQMHPDVPGRALANLVLHAPKELSGQYLHWDDPKVAAL